MFIYINAVNTINNLMYVRVIILKKLTDIEFKSRVYNLVKNEYIFQEKYINTHTHLNVLHVQCGNIYPVTPHDFLSGRRCPFCSGKMKKTTTQYIDEVYILTKGEYSVLGEYLNNKTKILMRHNLCNTEFSMRPDCFISGQRCPHCADLRRHQYNSNNKIYDINQNFFLKWSHDMAYILGLIASDGNLSKSKFRVSISSIDYDLLNTVRNKLCCNKPIASQSNKLGTWYLLTIDNKYIYESLINLGLTPNKSFTCNIPNIPLKYEVDFLRGFFDGDGCVYERRIRGYKRANLSIDIATASENMKNILLSILNRACNDCKYGFKCQIRKKDGLFILRGHHTASKHLYNKMYYDNCIHLKRKKNKFESIINRNI